MPEAISIKSAECNLEELLKRLSLGESITLIGSEGKPVALLVSLKPTEIEKTVSDWETRMDTLAKKVSRAWKEDKSAVDILSEMRR